MYGQAFFGEQTSDETKARVKKQLTKNVAAFARLAKFSPYVVGDSFTLADCAAIFHLPLAVMACKSVLGEDLLAELPIKAYTQQFATNHNVQKVMADRKANSEIMIALRSRKK